MIPPLGSRDIVMWRFCDEEEELGILILGYIIYISLHNRTEFSDYLCVSSEPYVTRLEPAWRHLEPFLLLRSEGERATLVYFLIILELCRSHKTQLAFKCLPWHGCVCAIIWQHVSKLSNCCFCLNLNFTSIKFLPQYQFYFNLDYSSIWLLPQFELSDGSVQIARLLSKLPFSSQFASCQCPVASGQSQDCG